MNKVTHKPDTTIAEVELTYSPKVKASNRPKIVTSSDAYTVFLSTWDIDKIELFEEFKVLLLNRANRVLGVLKVSSGGITGTVADPRLILVAALKSASISILLCHNHPSGSLLPSQSDEQLTQKIKQACQYLDISVLDHLVISKEGYYSFADEGLI